MRDRIDVGAIEPPGVSGDAVQHRALLGRQALATAVGEGLPAQARAQHGGAEYGQQCKVPAHHQPTLNVVSLPPTELSPTHRWNCPGSITNWPWSL